MLEELFEIQIEAAASVDLSFKRYLYDRIDWGTRLFCIVGARGVGKTTLLLQSYREKYRSPEECLYISADNIKVAAWGLFDIASEFFKTGGLFLIIDEIHKYPSWARELKNIYDSFPKAKIAITGSSSLGLLGGKHDFSRRMMVYYLKGLSFREYLQLETGASFKTHSIEEIVRSHVSIASSVRGKTSVLKYFKEYLNSGYYPFYLEGREQYHVKLNNVVEKVLSEDIPALFGLKASSVPLLRKLIYLIATSQPFTPNMERISSQLGISREYAYHYLDYLEKAGIFAAVYPDAQGLKLVRKPQKVYLENPNLFYAVLGAVGFRSEIGAVRESFFLNQAGALHKVAGGDAADFVVDGRYHVEVGGTGKDRKQVAGKKNSFIAADGLEIGAKDKIPLWLMGFLY